MRTASPLIVITRLGTRAALALPDNACARFHYVLDSGCQVVVGGKPEAVEEGDFILFPHGNSHILRTDGASLTGTNIVEHLRSHDLPVWSAATGLERPLFLDIGEPPTAATLLSGAIVFQEPGAKMLLPHLPELILFRKASREISDLTRVAAGFIADVEHGIEEPGFSPVALRMLELLAVMALRRWLLDTAHESGWLRGLQDPVISKALHAMHRDPGRQWQVGLLAEEAGCSRTRFALRFRDIIGETPFGYLTRLRIGIASSRLRETHRSVEQIAADLGYSGAHAFSRAFSEHVGRTPSQFRRNHAAKAEADRVN